MRSSRGPYAVATRRRRLHGCRRYDPMDGEGRTASGTAVESNSGSSCRDSRQGGREGPRPVRRQSTDGLSANPRRRVAHSQGWRLHGCRRYDPMDGGGRTASGTAVERPLKRILRSRHSHILVQHNAGAVAEQLLAIADLPPGHSNHQGTIRSRQGFWWRKNPVQIPSRPSWKITSFNARTCT